MNLTHRSVSSVAFTAACLAPPAALAQSLDQIRPWEAGDKFSHAYVLNGKAMPATEEVTEVAGDRVRTRQRIGGRPYDAAYGRADMARLEGVCVANSEACRFEPGEAWVVFPLEKGAEWSHRMVVTGEKFVSEVTQQRKVEAVTAVETPAGQFTAWRISMRGEIEARHRDASQPPLKGTERATYWWSTVKGKLVLVRQEYENSFGARSSRELFAVDFR
jgi:hypothetical protein